MGLYTFRFQGVARTLLCRGQCGYKMLRENMYTFSWGNLEGRDRQEDLGILWILEDNIKLDQN
jgi:hypothetical protein